MYPSQMKVGVLLCVQQRHLGEPAILSFFLVNEHGKSIYVLLYSILLEIRRGFWLIGRQPEQPEDEPPWRYIERKTEWKTEKDGGERAAALEAMQEKYSEKSKNKAGANEGWGKAFLPDDLPLWQHLAQEQTRGFSRCEVERDKKNPEACNPPPSSLFSFSSNEVEDRDGGTKLKCRHADEEEEKRRRVFGMW